MATSTIHGEDVSSTTNSPEAVRCKYTLFAILEYVDYARCLLAIAGCWLLLVTTLSGTTLELSYQICVDTLRLTLQPNYETPLERELHVESHKIKRHMAREERARINSMFIPIPVLKADFRADFYHAEDTTPQQAQFR